MLFRTLRPSDREALLELLDGWELADGWRGRDFFRRTIELDARYADENVWVAEQAGRLRSCVQIFPREVRLRGASLPLGGIGSVYTEPALRGTGLASALLERAGEAMRRRGMLLSLLFAGPLELYAGLDWHSWGTRVVYRRDAAGARAGAGEPFDPARDLDAVAGLHAVYSGALDGTVVRDASGWRTSLRLSGNPSEEFRVARDGAEICAYARATRLYGLLFVLEFGRAPDAAPALADLLAQLLTPRDPDPLAPPGKPSAGFRGLATGWRVDDPELERALAARGVKLARLDDPGAMLRCLDAPALARFAGVDPKCAEASRALLVRVLPPERFTFWPADRF